LSSIIQGWYNTPINGHSNGGLGSIPAKKKKKKMKMWNARRAQRANFKKGNFFHGRNIDRQILGRSSGKETLWHGLLYNY
jgi:hypothetical protein